MAQVITYVIIHTQDRGWIWRAQGYGQRRLAESTQGYTKRSDAIRALKNLLAAPYNISEFK